jgi:transposase
MAKGGETERETIRISAEAARGLLPRLVQKKAQLEHRIANLQAVIDAWDALSGKRLKPDRAENGGAGSPSKSRARKGQVPAHIDEVLRDGRKYEEPELREAIKKQFGVEYQRGTIYTTLRRGIKAHKYEQDGNKWNMNPAIVG